jgi:quercetin dioxygenase-like cupin family protein
MASDQNKIACPFPVPSRIITTHDPKTGQAVFSNAFEETPPVGLTPRPGGEPSRMIRAYSTNTFPVKGMSPPSKVVPDEEANQDLKSYAEDLETPKRPDGSSPASTSCIMFDLPPGAEVPMHRTVSLDCGVILDGEIELQLDSGETKILKKGDMVVQRGTAHGWKNVTPLESNGGWSRMFFAVMASEKIKSADGKELQFGIPLQPHESIQSG